MKREEFKNWLINDYKEGQGMNAGSAENRISNAQKVENALGDLDQHFENDKLESLMIQLKYAKGETKPLPEGIDIKGNYVDGMATLRQSVRRYLEFKRSESK
ncbi:hypothetical protein [Chryseobacterium camelliae]|uniref:hypothetical protein n=1 Tax=Chryseobacterium camelliae TaxID=1265445 RepID=UPI000C1C9335|nr:hypothetical protein [Chryseobacterium camelliae]